MSRDGAERALLFGSLAYRLRLLDAPTLARVVTAAVDGTSLSVEDALRQVGGCDDAALGRVAAAASSLLPIGGGDPARALAAAPLDPTARSALARLNHPELRAA